MLTIVINAFKEPKTIGLAIESFEKQLKSDYEILAISPDTETIKVIKEHMKKNKRIKFLRDPGKGKPCALNLAFKKAIGDILILSDGDVYVSENSVTPLIAPFKDKEVGAVTGRPVPTNKKDTMLGFWAHLLTQAGAHRRRLELQAKNKFITCSGYLYAIRKGIINKIPENVLSDDALISNLVYTKGYKTKYAPEATVNVKFPTNIKDWLKQKVRSAGGYNQLKEFNQKDSMRSFSKESSKIAWALGYPKTIKEFIWTLALIFTRIYLWILIFIDINIKKKSFNKVWVRIESTK